MSKRHLLTPPDRQLLDRLEREAPDQSERAKRRRLFDGDLSDYGGSDGRANAAMEALLRPFIGGDSERLDRIVVLCVWGVVRDWDTEYFEPQLALEARSPAATCPTRPSTAVQPAAQVVQTPSPQPTRTGNTVPDALAQPPAPIVRPPCTAAAVEFLERALANGERESREVQAQGKLLALTPAMIRAARKRLGIVTEKRGFGSLCRGWWRLPLVTTDVRSGVTRIQPAGVTPSAAQGEVTR